MPKHVEDEAKRQAQPSKASLRLWLVTNDFFSNFILILIFFSILAPCQFCHGEESRAPLQKKTTILIISYARMIPAI